MRGLPALGACLMPACRSARSAFSFLTASRNADSSRRRLALLAFVVGVFGGEDLWVFGMGMSYPPPGRFHT